MIFIGVELIGTYVGIRAHGVGFTGARLAVGKHRAIVAGFDAIGERADCVDVHGLLVVRIVEYVIEMVCLRTIRQQ